VEYAKFAKQGLFILVKGRVQKRFNQETWEFKINHIELLSEVRKNHVKTFTVNIALHLINKSLIEDIEKLAKNNKGSSLLRFNIIDEKGREIKMFSRNTRIKVDNSFLEYFDNYPGIEYRIN
jgi:DNA polymerase-3 subunit alpha